MRALGPAATGGRKPDQQDNGAEMNLNSRPRQFMSRLGIDVQAANSLLTMLSASAQISTIYQPMNQYKVVMEVDPRYSRDISALEKMFVINRDGKAIPSLISMAARCAAVGEPSGTFRGPRLPL